MTNPLLASWDTPFGLPPFADVRDEDFAPALDSALNSARHELAAITENPAHPSFANTIDALELMGGDLEKVLGTFYALAGTDSNPARQALQRDFAPKLSAFQSEVSMNAELFARIDQLWQNRDDLDLTAEQARVLMLHRRDFVRSGAQLEGKRAERLKTIKARLAVLGTAFTQNLLADERDWFMALDECDLDGLPGFVVDAARAAGSEKGAEAAVITTSRSLIVPFLQFSPRRDLREKAFVAWTSRGAGGGETDNRAITAEILNLRHERAALLGYASFADYKLETEMAKTPAAVRDLLMRVWTPARAAALADAKGLEAMLHEDGVNGDLAPWDWRYYSEKRRAAEHELSEEELKPYFQLERMIEAAFDCATRLFRLEFTPLDGGLYHADVRAWEVTRDGNHMAVFVADYFARSGKRSGAWCSAWRSQRKLGGEVRPLVHNVCNFAKPPTGEPALLSYDDARTLFHEFGHALHQMLSDVTYDSISGTSVARDFVELPSQLFEHWLEEPEVLAKHTRHAKTGAPMPADLMARLLDARTYDMGFQTVEFVASALVDLAFHEGEAPTDPMALQRDVLDAIEMPPAITMRHATPHFAHVFAGDGYSSGYYSYMWSEMMDADAFSAFEEAGGAFDAEMAEKLEKCLLSYHRAECLTHVGDSQAVRSLTQCGEPMRFAMAAPIDLRNDFDSVSLRRLAKRTRDATQSRRLLALAEVYDGGSRTDASRIGGVGLQIIRDWVLRFNARGPDGLVDGKSPGAPSKLNADHRRALAEVVEAGPVPAADGVVRWRRKDLARWLLETFAISLDETTVGRELKALGFAKISARPRHYAQNELAVEAFKKNFPAELAKIRARLPKGVEIELWWQDEARIGQKNKLTRRWARRGTRPRAPRDQRTEWAYIFGAICPAKGKGAGLVMPWCDTDAMAAHLIEISAAVDPGAHAVLIVDQAGWHLTPKLAIPDNITVLALPPRSPELNPVENVWQFMRDNWLSNRIFKSYEDIVALCCQAWNNLIDQPWKIMSLGMRKWAHGF